ncbi:MAG TPA: PD-(D/E)XK nuclease domain-containing protein [Myxococcota bacterium]|nr:PD-(D/E)XK nuclease domain-containing protein [Myxococcota bacterium]
MLGLLVHLDAGWEVRSNLEMGYGRADVVVWPRQAGRPGVILELKRIDEGEDVEAALTGALEQLAARGYADGLREASPLHEIAIVFAGKRPYVRFRR